MQTLSAAARTQAARLRLKKSRRLATALLLAAAALFCLSAAFLHRYPQLAYLKAFSEAAMIGGLADWFAVTALFRRPLGLPVPHTAILPRNQNRIADELGRFIEYNFLRERPVALRVYRAAPTEKLLPPSAASGCPRSAPACPTCCKPYRPNRPPALPPNCWPNNTTAAKSAARWPTAWNC